MEIVLFSSWEFIFCYFWKKTTLKGELNQRFSAMSDNSPIFGSTGIHLMLHVVFIENILNFMWFLSATDKTLDKNKKTKEKCNVIGGTFPWQTDKVPNKGKKPYTRTKGEWTVLGIQPCFKLQ